MRRAEEEQNESKSSDSARRLRSVPPCDSLFRVKLISCRTSCVSSLVVCVPTDGRRGGICVVGVTVSGGGSNSGLLDVTLTENREGHVGVSGGARHSKTSRPHHLLPLVTLAAISLPRASVSSSHDSPARTSESLISDEPI